MTATSTTHPDGSTVVTAPAEAAGRRADVNDASQYSAIAERYRQSTRRSCHAGNYRDLLTNWAGLSDVRGLVLDVGCGEGTYTSLLRNLFPSVEHVVGIDASEDMIRLAKADYPQVDFRCEDMRDISLGDAVADFVFSRLAIHYSSDLVSTVAELGRVTRPGGLFFLQDAHPFYSTFLKRSRDYERKENVAFPAQCDETITVVHPSFTFEEYSHAFTTAGWSIRSIREVYGRRASEARVAPHRVPTTVCFLLHKQ